MDFSIKALDNTSKQFKFQLLNTMAFAFVLYQAQAISYVTGFALVLVSMQLYLGRLNWIFLTLAILVSQKFYLNNFIHLLDGMIHSRTFHFSGFLMSIVLLMPLLFTVLIRTDIFSLIPKEGDYKKPQTKFMEWGMAAFMVVNFCYVNFYILEDHAFLIAEILILSCLLFIIYNVQKSVYVAFFFFAFMVLINVEQYIVQLIDTNSQYEYIENQLKLYVVLLLPLAFLIVLYATEFNSEKQKALTIMDENIASEPVLEEPNSEMSQHKLKLTEYLLGILLVYMGVNHFLPFFTYFFSFSGGFSASDYANIFLGCVFIFLGVWQVVSVRNNKKEVTKTILILASIAFFLSVVRLVVLDNFSIRNGLVMEYIFFIIPFLIMMISIVRTKDNPKNQLLYELKRKANYLLHSLVIQKNNPDLTARDQVNVALLEWTKRKKLILILFVICFIRFYTMCYYVLFLSKFSSRSGEISDLMFLFSCICFAVIFQKIVRAVVRLDNAFVYFLVCYEGLNLLATAYVMVVDVELIYGATGILAVISLGIFLFGLHITDLNKKHRQELLSKMDHDFSNNPDLLD